MHKTRNSYASLMYVQYLQAVVVETVGDSGCVEEIEVKLNTDDMITSME